MLGFLIGILEGILEGILISIGIVCMLISFVHITDEGLKNLEEDLDLFEEDSSE